MQGKDFKTHSLGELRSTGWESTPEQSGIYWWFFDQACLDRFGINEHCDGGLQLKSNESGNSASMLESQRTCGNELSGMLNSPCDKVRCDPVLSRRSARRSLL